MPEQIISLIDCGDMVIALSEEGGYEIDICNAGSEPESHKPIGDKLQLLNNSKTPIKSPVKIAEHFGMMKEEFMNNDDVLEKMKNLKTECVVIDFGCAEENCGNNNIWLAYKNSCVVKMFNLDTRKFEAEVDVSEAVVKMLFENDAIVHMHKTETLKVTSMTYSAFKNWLAKI